MAVYTQRGACVGSGVFNGAGVALALWADDPFTPDVDGFVAGDRPEIRVFDASTSTTYAGADVTSSFEDGFGMAGNLSADHVYLVAARPTPPPTSAPTFWISEVDAVVAGGAGFVEIQSSAPGAVLPDLTLAAFGASGQRYGSVSLSGYKTDANGLLVVRPEGAAGGPGEVHMPGVAAFGAELGAFGLYAGSAPSRAEAGSIDAMVYGQKSVSRSKSLLRALDQTVQYVDAPATSSSRPAAGRLFYAAAPTPGALNSSSVTVATTTPDDGVRGLRLVSVPVVSEAGTPLTVADLGQQNPVRGVHGGTDPDAAPNVWTGFDAAGRGFVAPASAGASVAPGRGFLWGWEGPAGQSFQLVQSGRPLDDATTGGPYTWTVASSAPSGHYLVGNPYAYPLRLAGVSVGGATLQTAFATWDPVDGTYVDLFADADDPGSSDVLPVWAGALAEVSAVSAQSFTVSTTSALVDPTATPSVSETAARPARPRTATVEPLLSFEISGALASGARVVDRSAHLRFVEGAGAEWDVHDATKLSPPSDDFVLLAPVGVRDGAPLRQRVLSLAPGATGTVPLAFSASQAGGFVVRWTRTSPSADQTAELVDLVTGARVALASASEYAFATSGPSAWADRFEVRLTGAATASEPVASAEAVVGQPHPNPSTGPVRLSVRPASAQRVVVSVYDAVGRRVLQPFDGATPAGGGADVEVDLRGFAPGVYVVRVVGETFVETRRVTAAR